MKCYAAWEKKPNLKRCDFSAGVFCSDLQRQTDIWLFCYRGASCDIAKAYVAQNLSADPWHTGRGCCWVPTQPFPSFLDNLLVHFSPMLCIFKNSCPLNPQAPCKCISKKRAVGGKGERRASERGQRRLNQCLVALVGLSVADTSLTTRGWLNHDADI